MKYGKYLSDLKINIINSSELIESTRLMELYFSMGRLPKLEKLEYIIESSVKIQLLLDNIEELTEISPSLKKLKINIKSTTHFNASYIAK